MKKYPIETLYNTYSQAWRYLDKHFSSFYKKEVVEKIKDLYYFICRKKSVFNNIDDYMDLFEIYGMIVDGHKTEKFDKETILELVDNVYPSVVEHFNSYKEKNIYCYYEVLSVAARAVYYSLKQPCNVDELKNLYDSFASLNTFYHETFEKVHYQTNFLKNSNKMLYDSLLAHIHHGKPNVEVMYNICLAMKENSEQIEKNENDRNIANLIL